MIKFCLLMQLKFSQRKHINVPCWNCKSIDFKNLFICGSCDIIQKPEEFLDSVNFFQMFELPEKMQITAAELNSKYREIQKEIHPDKFIPLQNEVLLKYSEHISSTINEAYHTLKYPARRAEYILQINGFTIKEDAKMNDLKFMEEILDLQESIADSSGEERDKIKKQASDVKEKMISSLSQQLDERKFKEAFEQLQYLRYFERLIHQADTLEESEQN